MGFKCPICLDDFGRDKSSWQKHTSEKHHGAGLDVVTFIIKEAECCDECEIDNLDVIKGKMGFEK